VINQPKHILRAFVVVLSSAAALLAATPERWIHVRVENSRGTGVGMSVNLPISMASAALSSIPSDSEHRGKFSIQASVNGTDLRAVLDAVRNSPDNTFVTLERRDKIVSVAKSGRNLLVRIADRPGLPNHLDKTIDIKIPVAVVRAMLADHSDDLDIAAGIRVLAREGDVDVTMNNQKETVRIWTDTSTASD